MLRVDEPRRSCKGASRYTSHERGGMLTGRTTRAGGSRGFHSTARGDCPLRPSLYRRYDGSTALFYVSSASSSSCARKASSTLSRREDLGVFQTAGAHEPVARDCEVARAGSDLPKGAAVPPTGIDRYTLHPPSHNSRWRCCAAAPPLFAREADASCGHPPPGSGRGERRETSTMSCGSRRGRRCNLALQHHPLGSRPGCYLPLSRLHAEIPQELGQAERVGISLWR